MAQDRTHWLSVCLAYMKPWIIFLALHKLDIVIQNPIVIAEAGDQEFKDIQTIYMGSSKTAGNTEGGMEWGFACPPFLSFMELSQCP